MKSISLTLPAALALAGFFLTCQTTHVAAGSSTWIAAWGASPVAADTGITLSNVTVRESTHLSLGGSQIRVRISNTFGSSPVTIGHATVATSSLSGASDLSAGTLQDLAFNGQPQITVPPGAQALSDALTFSVDPGQNLSVSLYLPDGISSPSFNYYSQATSYTSTAGDHTEETSGTAFTASTNSYFLFSGIDVYGSTAVGAVVTLGDSITEGYGSTLNANHRWPDYLAARLLTNSSVYGVVNEGIGGNQLLLDGGIFGVNGLARLDRDGLAQSGVKDVVLALGINDIIISGQLDPSLFATGYRQFAAQAHAVGVRVIGATITPFGAVGSQEGTRQSVNASIRGGGIFDAYVDFDAAVRDPSHPNSLLPAYDSGDHLHPNDAGYKAMANQFSLSSF
jgi:lysophospholipase L1-like esterase